LADVVAGGLLRFSLARVFHRMHRLQAPGARPPENFRIRVRCIHDFMQNDGA
jgi:hypothetical protein